MTLFKLLEKIYKGDKDLPRKIKYKDKIYVIDPAENYTYYMEGESHCKTMEIDTFYLDQNVEILEYNTKSLKEEISNLSDRLKELKSQIEDLQEEIEELEDC